MYNAGFALTLLRNVWALAAREAAKEAGMIHTATSLFTDRPDGASVFA